MQNQMEENVCTLHKISCIVNPKGCAFMNHPGGGFSISPQSKLAQMKSRKMEHFPILQ
jgi:hypothetical protein